MTQSAKLTISLPKEMILFADKLAKEKKTSRSKAIATCLQEAARKQLEAELEEGYRAMAKENKKMAELALDAQWEVLPEWKPGKDA